MNCFILVDLDSLSAFRSFEALPGVKGNQGKEGIYFKETKE